MFEIAEALDIQMMHIGKMVTILEHNAEYKYDLCKPTILYDNVG